MKMLRRKKAGFKTSVAAMSKAGRTSFNVANVFKIGLSVSEDKGCGQHE